MAQLKEFQHLGKTSITVHHDLNTVPAYFDSVMLLNRELIALGPLDDTFTQANIDLAYYGAVVDRTEPAIRQGSVPNVN